MNFLNLLHLTIKFIHKSNPRDPKCISNLNHKNATKTHLKLSPSFPESQTVSFHYVHNQQVSTWFFCAFCRVCVFSSFRQRVGYVRKRKEVVEDGSGFWNFCYFWFYEFEVWCMVCAECLQWLKFVHFFLFKCLKCVAQVRVVFVGD